MLWVPNPDGEDTTDIGEEVKVLKQEEVQKQIAVGQMEKHVRIQGAQS